MYPKYWIALACVLAAISVGLGAFGAHGLPTRLTASGVDETTMKRRVENLETGARYQMYHAIALLCIGILLTRTDMPGAQASCWLMTVGILGFSGWLYGHALFGSTRWPLITPLGGLCFILAWVNLAFSVVRAKF